MALMGDVPINSGMGIVLGLIAAFCWGGIYLFIKGYKNGMTVKLVRLLSKIPGLRWLGRTFLWSAIWRILQKDETGKFAEFTESEQAFFLWKFRFGIYRALLPEF